MITTTPQQYFHVCVFFYLFSMLSQSGILRNYIWEVSASYPHLEHRLCSHRFSSLNLVDYDKWWKSRIPITYPKNYIHLRVLLGYDIKNITDVFWNSPFSNQLTGLKSIVFKFCQSGQMTISALCSEILRF